VIGATGIKDDRRAVISVRSCADDCNVVSARTRFYPAEIPVAAIRIRCPDYRDLQEEAYAGGLLRMCGGFAPLFAGRRCPRCHVSGELRLDVFTYCWRDPEY
jgi:hypothetical protein